MRKNFTIVLPDEPYKTTTDLNITVNATYNGSRYLVVSVDPDHIVHHVAYSTDNIEEINLELFIQDNREFFILDASLNPFEAAYLTREYTHDAIDNPEFELPNNLGSWTYTYEGTNSVLGQIYSINALKYDIATSTFTPPSYRTHMITRESFMAGLESQATSIKEALLVNDYSTEDTKTFEDYVVWLESVKTKYKDVDHWKIPFDVILPPL